MNARTSHRHRYLPQLTFLLLAALATGLVLPATAPAATIKVKWIRDATAPNCSGGPQKDLLVTALGSWRVLEFERATLARASRNFGMPYRTRNLNSYSLRAFWRGRNAFKGRFTRNADDPNNYLMDVVLTGKGWRTWRGVKIGDSVRRLRSRHGDARSGGKGRWKIGSKCTWTRSGDTAYRPTLVAHARKGKIRRFTIEYQ